MEQAEILYQGGKIADAGHELQHDTKRLRDYLNAHPTARLVLPVRARDVPVTQNNLTLLFRIIPGG